MLILAKIILIFDLILIHKIFNDIKTQYLDKSVRFQYFSAICLCLVADNIFDFFFQNRPSGGLIGIDNSSLEKHMKQFNFLRLHAILHDAVGYLQEKKPDLETHMFCPVQTKIVI